MRSRLLTVICLLSLSSLSVAAQTIYEVVSKRLEVLSQADLDSQVLGHKKEHDLVEVYTVQNGWALIKYESGTGFVDHSCIRPLVTEAADSLPQQSTGNDGVDAQAVNSTEDILATSAESSNVYSWSGNTIYTKSMINGEDAFFYQGLYYVVLSRKRNTVALVKPKKVKYKDSSYVIPSKVNLNGEEFTVTEIAPSAFLNCSHLESVTLPETLEAINAFSFALCKRLSYIDFPANLKYVGTRAFFMDEITDIVLPNSMEEVADEAFLMCKNRVLLGHAKMGRLFVPNTIKVIGKHAFCGFINAYGATWTAKFDIQNLPVWVTPSVAKEIGIHEDSYDEYIRRSR